MVKLTKNFFMKKKLLLWRKQSLRIARKTLGGGVLYAEIYKNNKKIIDDPDLIFPGQVFKIPNLKQSVFMNKNSDLMTKIKSLL